MPKSKELQGVFDSRPHLKTTTTKKHFSFWGNISFLWLLSALILCDRWGNSRIGESASSVKWNDKHIEKMSLAGVGRVGKVWPSWGQHSSLRRGFLGPGCISGQFFYIYTSFFWLFIPLFPACIILFLPSSTHPSWIWACCEGYQYRKKTYRILCPP